MLGHLIQPLGSAVKIDVRCSGEALGFRQLRWYGVGGNKESPPPVDGKQPLPLEA